MLFLSLAEKTPGLYICSNSPSPWNTKNWINLFDTFHPNLQWFVPIQRMKPYKKNILLRASILLTSGKKLLFLNWGGEGGGLFFQENIHPWKNLNKYFTTMVFYVEMTAFTPYTTWTGKISCMGLKSYILATITIFLRVIEKNKNFWIKLCSFLWVK